MLGWRYTLKGSVCFPALLWESLLPCLITAKAIVGLPANPSTMMVPGYPQGLHRRKSTGHEPGIGQHSSPSMGTLAGQNGSDSDCLSCQTSTQQNTVRLCRSRVHYRDVWAQCEGSPRSDGDDYIPSLSHTNIRIKNPTNYCLTATLLLLISMGAR